MVSLEFIISATPSAFLVNKKKEDVSSFSAHINIQSTSTNIINNTRGGVQNIYYIVYNIFSVVNKTNKETTMQIEDEMILDNKSKKLAETWWC